VHESAIKEARILIVDDEPANVLLLERLLDVSGFTNVSSTQDSAQVVALCAETEPDAVLLDLHMPDPDGFAVLELLAPWTRGEAALPIIVLTADTTWDARVRALELGARDFLSKPFDMSEVILRVRNAIEVRLLNQALRAKKGTLERRVKERTRDLEETRLEVVVRLAVAAEYRDDDSGRHPERVGQLAALLAEGLELPAETVDLIRRAAPLHDVGKVGIPDSILLAPGKLTPLEFEAMKAHVEIGAEILGRSRSPLLRTGEEIALTHHERWDGTGYLAGLAGEDIPLSGRIVAVADVFDTLIHRRPYREAWPVDRAADEIRRTSGRHFDPRVVAAFEALDLDELTGVRLVA
jgi:putative two-component system response regulator